MVWEVLLILLNKQWCSHGWLSACLCTELLKAWTYSYHRGGAACSRRDLQASSPPSSLRPHLTPSAAVTLHQRALETPSPSSSDAVMTSDLCFIFCCCCCSVAKSCLTLCDPTDCSTPGSPVLHYLLEFAQTHVLWAGDTIQPSHPLTTVRMAF